MPRQRLRRAAELAEGLRLAFSSENVGRHWAEAATTTDAEADEVLCQANWARSLARAKSQVGFTE